MRNTLKNPKEHLERHFKEQLKVPSPSHGHCNTSGHLTTFATFGIVEREEKDLTGAVKDAIFLRVNGPSLNRKTG